MSEEERKLLTEGLIQSIQKLEVEVIKTAKHAVEATRVANDGLVARVKLVEAFSKNFGVYLRDKLFIFQKFSPEGLVLVKDILAKAYEEVSKNCIEDLASEISKK